MNRSDYLSRIGLKDEGLTVDIATLRLLQREHLLCVPFENLDIHWHRPIVLDTERFYKKIVEEKRGGFCYELNGLFNELLCDLGFRTRLISARVWEGSRFTSEYDHAAIIVTLGEEEYLVDVGFGAFAAEPLRFLPDIEQQDPAGLFQLRRGDDGYFIVSIRKNDGWRDEYMFQPLGRTLDEFSGQCEWQQYSPDSSFIKGKLISILLDDGRKTLTNKRFIVLKKGERSENLIDSESEFDQILLTEFGILRPSA